ncbi:hypothetical protein AVEN_271743-1 [Araneus ventricosus]|uniref:Uncharacterized protein n=1 Tax=Araneus ventricosus TaxID=182803 RepID=A0A4Y2SQL3_ARAVE|nr:hypothetical protein AVEN_250160-1 [Araneus ventricosus]GBN89275.1 hypothetical protein AVEN_232976-1 [Araneus ventricosus]GBN90288.1 hypothetical protein AVEN_176900-1 [Araneus ventricosus]GBN90308.1 hypothetical protein AVEN_271743-1 [Araneus ventricosus]
MVPVTFQNLVEQLDKPPHHLLPSDSIKLGIHGRTVPHHLECVSPDISSFQLIHLAGHSWRLHANDATGDFSLPGLAVPISPPAFKTGHPTPRDSFTSPFPILWFSLL